MEEKRKIKLFNYYFGDKEKAGFLLNDLFLELDGIINFSQIYGNQNKSKEKRENNRIKTEKLIKEFIYDNENYKRRIAELYGNKLFAKTVSEISKGYVFSRIIDKTKNADVFRDKNSIYYASVSVLDVE